MGNDLNVTRRVVWVLAGLCVLIPAAAEAQPATRGLRAERFDVAMTLLSDGSVDVRETIVFRFSEKTFTKVEREIAVRRFDGVIDVRASLDGRLLTEEGPERVRIRLGRRSLRVNWTFPETIDQSRAFTLEYRAMGVLSVASGRARLDWTVLPSRHRYPIDEARVEWRVPATALRLEPTSLDDPRWTSEAMPDGWAAIRHGVGVNETATLTDAFDLTTMAVTVPEWQVSADRARQMAPAFVIGAATLLVMAAGVVGMTRFRYYVPRGEPRAVEPAAADSRPPAVGTALVRDAVGIGLAQVQATLLDLAKRGVVQFQENPDNPKRFDLVMPSPPDNRRTEAPQARPHEQAILDALWLHIKNGRVDLRTAWRHLARALPAFRRNLLSEMQESGLVDEERRSAAKGMTIAGIVVMVLGIAGFALFIVLFGHLGDVPLLVPGAVVLSGIGFLIAGQTTSLLSAGGVAAAAEWRARRLLLKAAVKSEMSAGDLAQWLPVAAGFGLASRMLKTNKGALAPGAAAFEWLGPVRNPGAALAVIVASTSTTAHHGGSGAGGAAGGGSSGAS